MNKGRLFVVNENTLQSTISNNIVSIYLPELTGRQWIKTLADIMADMLQVEKGDYIFLWETRNATQKSRIHGVYRAISSPYYEMTDEADVYPFKIKIEKAYDFESPLDEYDILNCPYIKTPLWTIIGKKVAGKARGTSPLSPDEIKNIITLLIGKNPDFSFIPEDSSRFIEVENPLHIDYLNTTDNPTFPTRETINPNSLSFFKSDYSVRYEKVLETIFNQELSSRNAEFFNQLDIDVNHITWFCNYLPYSIEQSEMDYLILESDDGIIPSKISLIEFMNGQIDESHIYRSMLYSKWVNETLALGTQIVQPILICSKSPDFVTDNNNTRLARLKDQIEPFINNSERDLKTKNLKIYAYDFSSGVPVFIRKK